VETELTLTRSSSLQVLSPLLAILIVDYFLIKVRSLSRFVEVPLEIAQTDDAFSSIALSGSNAEREPSSTSPHTRFLSRRSDPSSSSSLPGT